MEPFHYSAGNFKSIPCGSKSLEKPLAYAFRVLTADYGFRLAFLG